MSRYTFCCVLSCENNRAMHGISLHNFPKDQIIRRKWQQVVRFGKKFEKAKCKWVCSAHFRTSDFQEGCSIERRLLEPGAVPSIFSWPMYVNERGQPSGYDATREPHLLHDGMRDCEARLPELVEVPSCQYFTVEEKPMPPQEMSLKHDLHDTIHVSPFEVASIKEESYDVPAIKQEVEETVSSMFTDGDVIPGSSSNHTEYKIVNIQDIFSGTTSHQISYFLSDDTQGDIPKTKNAISSSSINPKKNQCADEDKNSMLKISIATNQNIFNQPNKRESILKKGFRLRCKQCKKIVPGMTSATTHKCSATSLPPNLMSRDAIKKLKSSPCTICGTIFISETTLQNHILLDHILVDNLTKQTDVSPNVSDDVEIIIPEQLKNIKEIVNAADVEGNCKITLIEKSQMSETEVVDVKPQIMS